MAAELKPCPFCGGNATVDAQFGREWWVECDDCQASTGGAEASREAAIAAWNRRATPGVKGREAPSFDVEAMLRACVPGGSICDPQQVADAIRAYFADGVKACDGGQPE